MQNGRHAAAFFRMLHHSNNDYMTALYNRTTLYNGTTLYNCTTLYNGAFKVRGVVTDLYNCPHTHTVYNGASKGDGHGGARTLL